jgi:hypothetical protein
MHEKEAVNAEEQTARDNADTNTQVYFCGAIH